MHEFPEIQETSLTEVCKFWVPGLPIQQGSKIAMMPRGHRRPIVMEAVSKELRAWRKQVKQEAEVAMLGQFIIEKPSAAKVWVQFVMTRPAGHRKTGPTRLCNVTPDLDKLMRAVGDALTAVCYVDDGLINAWHGEKRTAEPGEELGALITVYREDHINAE
jgi:Holliday junction resolvase RusA-like endonuclease